MSIALQADSSNSHGSSRRLRFVFITPNYSFLISITVIKDTDVHELAIRSADRYQWLRLQHNY